MKAIVENFEGSDVLVTQAKTSWKTLRLAIQLLKSKGRYECLVKLIEMMKSAKYAIKEAVEAIQELDLREDTCNTIRYIKKRRQNNDISRIINLERQYISPAAYSLLRNSQPTSACVGRSFSMPKKLLAKDRNFKAEKVKHYMILHFNFSTW